MKSRVALREFDHKTRVFIVSDISNEPDDAESLVRYLLYANEFDTRGLVACTSTWMKRVVHPEDMEKIVQAYVKVVENLNSHVSPKNPYPSGQEILQLIKAGPSVYGKEALESGVALSDGAKLLIERLDESDMSLWVLCWGGTNVIAQALQHVHLSRSAAECAKFRSKIRIYAISDQDDTGMWIRVTYPDIFYICSVHAWNQYGLAAWTGISGDKYYGFDKGGPDFTKVTKDWIAQNIQVGPLGSAYPDYMFIPEGDTPTFLYLVPNGLGSPENPSWGSWGGRYGATDPGQAGKHYSDLVDCVTGEDGRQHISNQATIWRWRDAFQNDFAARMQWTLTSDFSKANHHPVAIVNGHSVPGEALYINAEAGSEIVLDASDSYDPDDGDTLSFRWFHYKEVTATQWSVQLEVADVEIKPVDTESKIVKCVLPPPEKCAVDLFTRRPLKLGQVMHLILELKDGGNGTEHRLSTYKRVIVQITNCELRGGGGQAVENIASVIW